MTDRKYMSFTNSFEDCSSIDEFIEGKTEDYSPEYELFDFSVGYKGSSLLYPYIVTVVLERVDGPSPRNVKET